MKNSVLLPPTLARLAALGFDHLVTSELAQQLRCATQTIRKAYSTNGNYLGIRPLKVGGKLLWPIADVGLVLAGGAR
jgi:hypothetical protein